MADLHGSNSIENAEPVSNDNKGMHYNRVFEAIPPAIKTAPIARLKALVETKPAMPDWYAGASEDDRRELKALMDERWRLQGQLDKTLGDLQHDINAFAKPLLSNGLQSTFKTLQNVDDLTVQLEMPSKIIFGIDTGASRVRTSTMVQAALHNFEASETEKDAFRNSSGVYRKDLRGSLVLDPAITLPEFATLCRELDIGGQYQKHLQSILLPTSSQAKQVLQQESLASEKSAFHVAALTARLKGDICPQVFGKLGGIREGHENVTLDDRPLHGHRLSLMGFRLTGIVLFSAVSEPSQIKQAIDALTPDAWKFWSEWSERIPVLRGNSYDRFKLLQAFFANGPKGLVDEVIRKDDIHQQSRLTGTLIAYVPDDPDHPVKEYASLSDFMKTLISQLRNPDYQAFFSRFVAHKDKGHFFARVNERLKTFKWVQREPLDMGPWWRETAVENPNAEPITNTITGDLWLRLFIDRRDKAIADARSIAVPTDDEDATTRFKRLTSYLDIGWNIFSYAALLVPGLGEAVLGIMVAQMLAELAEGIEDWSKGDKEEGAAYINGVLINFAQLAIMGAGHVVPGGAVSPVKVSPFVEGLKPVAFGDGEKLWNPDLKPYEHPVAVPKTIVASEDGLYRHLGQDLLRIDDKHYALKQDPKTGQQRLAHPTRPDAYQPLLEHNGAGSWKTELDMPLEWDKATLLRRLGAQVDGLSDETLEQVLHVSGVHENALRRLHAEHETMPALMGDTLERFKAYADAEACEAMILANRVNADLAGFLPRFMTELSGWPRGKAIEVFEGTDLSGPSVKVGDFKAVAAQTLTLSHEDLVAGKLPEKVVDFLDETALRDVLGEWLSGDRTARIETLRKKLSEQAAKQKRQLFDGLYAQRERLTTPLVARLKLRASDLPNSLAEELLHHADPADLKFMTEKKRVPMALSRQSDQALEQLRLNRAYEGLYLPELYSSDTTRLVLHSLESLPGWPKDLRLEIRDYSAQGNLFDSVGAQSAPIRKVLVRSENGLFEARDELDQHLHGEDTLYAAVLHALPDAQRTALGFEIHDAQGLEKAIQDNPLSHERLEPILLENPIRKPHYDPEIMKLRGGMPGYTRQALEWTGFRRRVRSLYPAFTEAEVESLLAQYGQESFVVEQGLRGLEAEFDQLSRTLQQWVNSQTISFRFSPAGVAEWEARNRLYKLIRQCWQRVGPEGEEMPGVIRPQALILDDLPMGRHLVGMPKLRANFDHVTHLSLRNTSLLASQTQFLEPFRWLRQLDLTGNLLNRLPPEVSEMWFLTHLTLIDNDIALTQSAVARLKKLTQLKWLNMNGNPLVLVPDISQMPHLEILTLVGCGIDRWPVGLFSKPRPRHIYLDLRLNRLEQIPVVAPGSFRAELLTRTRLSHEPQWLSADNRNTLRLYAESIGMDPERPYPPRGVMDGAFWDEGMSREEWSVRQKIWDEVEDEYHSENFFNEIRKLTESADFKAGGAYRIDLTGKVWRMLEAMAQNTELREKLFNEALSPTECVDGGTQLFNAMGVEVLVHEAYALVAKDLVETQLLELARGKSRLDQLGAIARRRVSERLAAGERFRRVDAQGEVTGSIDEVEVHLAYMTELAQRLDLPWQARGMQFRRIAGVTPPMIEAAEQRILALEEGDLLRDSIAEQPLWNRYVKGSNRQAFKRLQRRIDATTEYKVAMDTRAEDLTLSPEEKDRLKEELRVLATELGKPESDFAAGQIMSEESYIADLELIDEEKNTLLKKLTQEAMDRAKIQRTEIPFTVEQSS
jgi:hypothetical protein